ncbi:hypothetical protein QJQ45_028832 [Haematococcus lacustris]|nr:hypothetical protein QJQ45_028832 [Haematococcus lacustris]
MEGGPAVQQLLLQEAQQEISNLRSDLYGQRRVAEEQRRAAESLSKEKEALREQVALLGKQLAAHQAEVARLQGIEAEFDRLKQDSLRQQQELALSLNARRILEQELAVERQARLSLEDAKAALEAERSRQQKQKDDLSAALRVAQKAVSDAEQEQLRAEEESAALRAEINALQHGGAVNPAAPARGSSSELADLVSQLEYQRSQTVLLQQSLSAADLRLRDTQQQHATEIDQFKQTITRLELHLAQATSAADGPRPQRQPVPDPQAVDKRAGHDRQAPNSLPAPGQLPGSASAQTAASTPQVPTSPGPPGWQPGPGVGHGHALSSGAASDSCTEDLEVTRFELERLQLQVTRLKASRDKLLQQVDRQWEELDKLGAEHKAVGDEAEQLRQLAAAWEATAQDSFGQVERLKEMLEEASSWGSSAAGQQARGKQPGAARSSAPGALAAVEASLLAERARSAELELQLRALAAELLRAQQASMAMGKAVLPVLSGVEHRLEDMQLRAQALQVGCSGGQTLLQLQAVS